MQNEIQSQEAERPILAGFVTVDQLARELGRSRRTLERWATLRLGPPRIVVGRMVLYRTDSVRAWLQANEKGVRRGRNGRK